MINTILCISAFIMFTSLNRIILEWQARAWLAARNYVADYTLSDNGDCTLFHEIMAVPKPWYVKLHLWLEERHV